MLSFLSIMKLQVLAEIFRALTHINIVWLELWYLLVRIVVRLMWLSNWIISVIRRRVRRNAKPLKVKFWYHRCWEHLFGCLVTVKRLYFLSYQRFCICSMRAQYLVRNRPLALPAHLTHRLILKSLIASFKILNLLILIPNQLVFVLYLILYMWDIDG